MVLINLTRKKFDAPVCLGDYPYEAEFIIHGKKRTYGIKDRTHLVRRFNELNKTSGCPDEAEINQMIENFPDVFENSY